MVFFKRAVLFCAGGSAYMGLELLWRGYSHVSMFAAGGVCFLLIGQLGQVQPVLPWYARAVAGAGIITMVELAAGLRLGFRLPASIKDIAFGNTMLGIGTEAEATRAAAAQAVEFAAANGVALPDHLLPNEWGGPQDESYENFREYLFDHYASIPAGVTETYLHPALESEELKAACDTWQHRVWEYRIMRDPATKQHIEAHGIKLINYRELSRMKEF